MTVILKTTAIATMLALGAVATGSAEASSLTPAPRAAIASGQAPSDVQLVGGPHWQGGAQRGYGHRHYRRGDNGAAIALGAAGAIIGLSAIAAANAYPAPAPYAYGEPVYAAPDDDYAYEEVPEYSEEAYPYAAEQDDYAAGSVDAYSPPPPPLPDRSVPQARNYASVAPSGSVAPEAWTQDWYNYCSSKYRSFNPSTGYFTTYSGEQKFCR